MHTNLPVTFSIFLFFFFFCVSVGVGEKAAIMAEHFAPPYRRAQFGLLVFLYCCLFGAVAAAAASMEQWQLFAVSVVAALFSIAGLGIALFDNFREFPLFFASCLGRRAPIIWCIVAPIGQIIFTFLVALFARSIVAVVPCLSVALTARVSSGGRLLLACLSFAAYVPIVVLSFTVWRSGSTSLDLSVSPCQSAALGFIRSAGLSADGADWSILLRDISLSCGPVIALMQCICCIRVECEAIRSSVDSDESPPNPSVPAAIHVHVTSNHNLSTVSPSDNNVVAFSGNQDSSDEFPLGPSAAPPPLLHGHGTFPKSLGQAIFGTIWTEDSKNSSFGSRSDEEGGMDNGNGLLAFFRNKMALTSERRRGPSSETETHLSSITTCNSCGTLSLYPSIPGSRSSGRHPLTAQSQRVVSSMAPRTQPTIAPPAVKTATMLFLSLREVEDDFASVGPSSLVGHSGKSSSDPLGGSRGLSSTMAAATFEAFLDITTSIGETNSGTVFDCSEDVVCIVWGLKPTSRDAIDVALDTFEQISNSPSVQSMEKQLVHMQIGGSGIATKIHLASGILQTRMPFSDLQAFAVQNRGAQLSATDRKTGEALLQRSVALQSAQVLFDHVATCHSIDFCLTRPVGVAPHSRLPIYQVIKRLADDDLVGEWHLVVEQREVLQQASAHLVKALHFFEEGLIGSAQHVLRDYIERTRKGDSAKKALPPGALKDTVSYVETHDDNNRASSRGCVGNDSNEILTARLFLSDLAYLNETSPHA